MSLVYQLAYFTSNKSHNAPFRTEMCIFLFRKMHCGIWDRCIMRFVILVNCCVGCLAKLHIYYFFCAHDDVIKWKHFPRYWPFVRGIHRSPVNSPHKGQWRGALMFSLICALNKRLSKQSWGWWFETPSRSLWRHCNVIQNTLNTVDVMTWKRFPGYWPFVQEIQRSWVDSLNKGSATWYLLSC